MGDVISALRKGDKDIFIKEGVAGSYESGFVPPEAISGYFCWECNKKYQVPPLVEVKIERESGGSGKGQAYYKCSLGSCRKVLALRFMESLDGFDTRLITLDETGDYRRPTIKEIEDRLDRAVDLAKRGEGKSLARPDYIRDFNQAVHWANKIEHPIASDEAKTLRAVFTNAYITNFQGDLERVVEEIKEFAYAFSLNETGGISPFEGTGLQELFSPLYEVIPFITVPEDLQLDVLKILDAYGEMKGSELKELVEKRKGLEEVLLNKQRTLGGVEAIRRNFITRTGLTGEQVHEARSNPLSERETSF